MVLKKFIFLVALVASYTFGRAIALLDIPIKMHTPFTDPEDYRGAMSVITFTAGQTRKLVNVNITDDRISESSEFFTATLSNASPSSRVEISRSLATVNIADGKYSV